MLYEVEEGRRGFCSFYECSSSGVVCFFAGLDLDLPPRSPYGYGTPAFPRCDPCFVLKRVKSARMEQITVLKLFYYCSDLFCSMCVKL